MNHYDYDKFLVFLDWIVQEFDTPKPATCLDHIEKFGSLPDNTALLTFDDGLRDHYHWVYPALKERGLSGLFFVSSQPLIQKGVLRVHKSHILYGAMGYEWFRDEFTKEYLSNGGKSEDLTNSGAVTAYPYDTKVIANFKYAMNFVIERSITELIVDRMMKTVVKAGAIGEEFYLNAEQMIEMRDNGMCFGFHGHSHEAFCTLWMREFEIEIEKSKEVFEEILGEKTKSISFPYGDANCIRQDQLQSLEKYELRVGFMAESCNASRLGFPRKDCLEAVVELLKPGQILR